DAGNFGADVEHEMIAIRKIDVGVAAAKKHRLIARSWPAKVMSGRVARRVGFGFDDAPGHAAGGKLANNDLANQESSQCDGSRREFVATKSANRWWLAGMVIDGRCFVNHGGKAAHASILPNRAYRVDAWHKSTKYPMFL